VLLGRLRRDGSVVVIIEDDLGVVAGLALRPLRTPGLLAEMEGSGLRYPDEKGAAVM
jgi:hypothetical protein